MMKEVSFSYMEDGEYIYRDYLYKGKPHRDRKMPMKYKREDIYSHRFLSWHNLSYCFTDYDIDEEDDYLLHHAMQDDKKTSVYIRTRNVDSVISEFGDEYNIHVEPDKNGFSKVFVLRKGTLDDYFDTDEIGKYYEDHGILYRPGLWEVLCTSEMVKLVRREIDCTDVAYYPLIDIDPRDHDPVFEQYGTAGGMVAGLLFGYPLESTLGFIKCLPQF